MRRWPIAVAGVVVAALWLAWAFQRPISRWTGVTWRPEVLGQWGDTFGALNAAFAAVGFIAVLATLSFQFRTISDQRRDLHVQRFETSFFQIIEMIRDARKEVRFKHSERYLSLHPKAPKRIVKGHAAFRRAFYELNFQARLKTGGGRKLDQNVVADLYAERVHRRYESTLGAYYRLLYTAYDRLRSDPLLTDPEKENLGNLLRGSLTSFEFTLAGCNGLNHSFAKDFDSLVTQFRLLKYARRGRLYDALTLHYPHEAFSGRDEEDGIVTELEDVEDDEFDSDHPL